MRTALVGLEKERQMMKEQVNHSHDRLIHRFPPEIAAYIFELYIPEDIMDIDVKQSSRYTMSAPFILSAVCRKWRAIAQSTPQLWKSLPLCISGSPSSINRAMPVTLVNQWIDRAGELPLSINLHVPKDAPRTETQIVNALNQHANRLVRLKYDGIPSFLPYFTEDLPQLQTLHLTTISSDPFPAEIFKPCPTQLNALSISTSRLISETFDWQHLTQLVLMEYLSISECFEALRKAPCLIQCTFRVHRRMGTSVIDHPSLPRNRILQPKLQYLEIRAMPAACDTVLSHLLCPNLCTLVLESDDFNSPKFDINTIIEFLQRSESSLERLSLIYTNLTASDVAALCEGIPTVQHLHIHALYLCRPSGRSPSKTLFRHLAKHSIINGTKEPELQYLPALRSLTWHKSIWDPWSWTRLLDIFGAPTACSTNRRRQTLESIKISGTTNRSDTLLGIDEETLKRILWLRDSVGMKWDICVDNRVVWNPGLDDNEEDIIQRAVDRYLLLQS